MKNYKRLTQKGKKWIESNHDEVEAYNRLAELEDKIERGELVENTVVTYVNMGRSGSKTLIDKALKFDALKAKIENGTLIDMPRIIHPNKEEWHVQYQYSSGIIQYYIVFSEAEAEEKLEELRWKNEK